MSSKTYYIYTKTFNGFEVLVAFDYLPDNNYFQDNYQSNLYNQQVKKNINILHIYKTDRRFNAINYKHILEEIQNIRQHFLDLQININIDIKIDADYWYPKNETQPEPLPSYLNLTYCIFNEDIDIYDSGADMINFTGSTIKGRLSLSHSVTSSLSFDDVTFTETAKIFDSGLFLNKKAEFKNHLSFIGTKFECVANFRDVIFHEVNFIGTVFEHVPNFKGFEFNKCVFHKKADFQGATFNNGANFYSCTFHDEADFYKVQLEIKAELMFYSCIFLKENIFNDINTHPFYQAFEKTFNKKRNT